MRGKLTAHVFVLQPCSTRRADCPQDSQTGTLRHSPIKMVSRTASWYRSGVGVEGGQIITIDSRESQIMSDWLMGLMLGLVQGGDGEVRAAANQEVPWARQHQLRGRWRRGDQGETGRRPPGCGMGQCEAPVMGVVLKQRSVGLDDRGRSTRWRTGGSCRGLLLLLLLVGVDGGAARLCCATRPCGC